VSGQITSGLIVLGIIFLLPGFLLALGLAMFMRHYKRFRSWIRITLILTICGAGMWVFAVRYLNVDIGTMQIGAMTSVVAIFSALLAMIAVWVVPRKRNPLRGVYPTLDTPENAKRPIKTPRMD
jgi:chromate transport protein ChrA